MTQSLRRNPRILLPLMRLLRTQATRLLSRQARLSANLFLQ